MSPVTLTFDLETGMPVASKLGNHRSKFGHARPLGSRIIRYVNVTDGRQTDGRTKATLIAPFPTGRSITSALPKRNTRHMGVNKFRIWGIPCGATAP